MIKKINTTKELIYLSIFIFITWIILAEFDTFEHLIEYLETHEEYELDELVLLFIIIGFVSIFMSIRRIKESIRINTHLSNINAELIDKVEEEIEKRRKKEELLAQQSKFAAMGEMIANIAHQWRQPLNALTLVHQNLEIAYKMDELDDEFVDKSMKKSKLLVDNMSKTIDDFKNFFNPNKPKQTFSISDSIDRTINLVSASFEHNNVIIEKITDNNNITLYGYDNMFAQALLNILNNAKDAAVSTKIKDPLIIIKTFIKDENIFIEILDNAGGIKKEIIEKIYDPYFTTKEEGKGTGIGLYMTKTIIQNLKGEIFVENFGEGSKFTIKFPVSNNEKKNLS